MKVNDEKGLGEAIRKNEKTIDVHGSIAPRIKRLHDLDKVLYCMCLMCLAVAVVALMQVPATGGGMLPLSFVAGTPAAAIMGVSTAKTAALVAASGGGISALKQLRKYKLKQVGKEHIILHKTR